MIPLKHAWLVASASMALASVGCSQQQPAESTTANTSTELSQPCAEYVAKIEQLAKKDDKLKSIVENNLAEVTKEWATLNLEEQEKFTKNCAMMNERLEKLD